MAEKTQRCCKCDLDLEIKQTVFSYMGMHFNHDLLRCPSCGQVYISEELVMGKIAEVEQLMEEK
ncbi:MAG: hypothetical protein LBS53_00860 [Synergistaceae bacterium]|jgi:uncharacterized Zn finger protein|nr:hypothetical protein [Synergistaceae bacterium]